MHHTPTAAIAGLEVPDFPCTNHLDVLDFHHVEFLCADAASAAGPSASAYTIHGPIHAARRFTADYGLAVRALAIRVADAAEAFSASVDAGARPTELGHDFVMAKVELLGDAVLRFVSYPDGTDVTFIPGFESVASSGSLDFGLTRFDHIACGVPDLASVASYIAQYTGFHEFSNFTAEKVGMKESALNGLVLANNKDTVLLTLLETVHGTKHGTKRPASDDLLCTLRGIRARSSMGGFELLPAPPPSYYDDVRQIASDVLSEEQIKECQEMGVLVDRDDHGGVVLQVFTKAAVDRPTLLLEFIQRIEGMENQHQQVYPKGGYGGFAKDNVNHIFF
ncbi:hypothetical protein CFC21_091612 [Triticum aestivum]|uniref:4-hydroxyphenylpyruvate dioxygenase n=2 Tax=Triticum aestivum TaxID=4565 RepID=A0A9R1LGQ9_WHEAT|nr:hypothetical protein CFC21_091612 [Triticum aestivum]